MEEYGALPENVVPLNDAVNACSNWRTLVDDKMPNDKVYAFKIPMIDFIEILHEDAVSIRAYLGEDSSGNKKMFLVGVDASGNDMIDYDNDQYVYDYSEPCPSDCDVNSPLM